MKRFFDIFFSTFGILLLIPIFIPVLFLVWIQDWNNPFYVADRVGRDQKSFKMIKIRSMIVNADTTGVQSTSNDDMRITYIGKFIRKFKLDELSQLINVFIGQMSFVGPRPNVIEEVSLYSKEELRLLQVRPGITDFSSIIFSDEGDILNGSIDPDLDYNQLIRPGKGYLGIFYIEKRNFILDIQLILLTILAIISKKKSLKLISKIIKKYEGSKYLIELSKREEALTPTPPPGMNEVVHSR
jgi:lipopolysaccharide/colanic/teichoic acid biosynthesis glycosyltransferase|tara:strand:- start:3011 stop:3736 length:726 start_codon:yes stop_codon:yes gene_type:complete